MPFDGAVAQSRGTDRNKSDGAEDEHKPGVMDNLEDLASDDEVGEDGDEPGGPHEDGGFGKLTRTFQTEKPSSLTQSQPR
jgi:hypothetical protein